MPDLTPNIPVDDLADAARALSDHSLATIWRSAYRTPVADGASTRAREFLLGVCEMEMARRWLLAYSARLTAEVSGN